MEFKQALAVSLIALVAATLVVLVARSLDNQAAARLEPQLVRIAEQLEAIRGGGGLAAAPGNPGGPGGAVRFGEAELRDGLIVYYFHGNTRCPTCRTIESQARRVIERDFAAQLAEGKIVLKTLNYEDRANADLAEKFEVQVPVVVLARVEQGAIAKWDRLDKVWALVGDPPAYEQYIRGELSQMLGAGEPAPTPAVPLAAPLPSPPASQPAEQPAAPDLPQPELPLPVGSAAAPSDGLDEAPSMLPTSGELPAPTSAADAPQTPPDEPALLPPAMPRSASPRMPAAEIGFPR